MELRSYLEILRRRWATVLIFALAGLALAGAVTLAATPRYTATTRLFFGVQGGESATDLAQGSTFAEKQMTSYAEVATSPLVLEPVIRNLDLKTTPDLLSKSVVTNVPTETVILEISVEDSNAGQAANIANAIGSRVAETAGQLSPERADGTQSVQATTLAPAVVPDATSSPNVLRNLGLGLLIGLIIGLALAALRQLLDTKIRNEDDVRAITDSAILGTIAFEDKVPDNPVVLRSAPHSPAAEAVRRLRTNLQFIDVANGTKSIVISSSVPGEGKSTTSVNLAVSLADAGTRVLLIDADLRRPSIAEYLGLEGRAGLTTVLIGQAEFDDVVQPWGDNGLDVLPAGQIPPNPSELLGSAAMGSLLERLTNHYDMVLIDSPPLLPVTDAAVLGRQAGGTLVVIGVDRIHKSPLRDSMESLEVAGAHVVGLVVNKIARRDVQSYSYAGGYYYGYSSDTNKAEPEAVAETSTSTERPHAGV